MISSVGSRRHMEFGQGYLHEPPYQQSLMQQVTVFSHTLQDLSDLPKVLAAAYGIASCKAAASNALRAALRAAIDTRKPALIEVPETEMSSALA
ncbi:hypothetical protein [Paracoccus alkanivorans]|uniref:hypothetical protein n=1 Tax=Paracoccus alkanivorans TaxID=2116655 RepID=UPI001FB81F4B|nr:hypothetical protein [Paracoccus alkanivorans]